MFEYSGNAHMHTPYSDGKKWHNEIAEEAISAGLDFIIVTDHNVWVSGPEEYYQEILENKAQLEEWKKLFHVEVRDLDKLKKEAFLVLDTKFFSQWLSHHSFNFIN